MIVDHDIEHFINLREPSDTKSEDVLVITTNWHSNVGLLCPRVIETLVKFTRRLGFCPLRCV